MLRLSTGVAADGRASLATAGILRAFQLWMLEGWRPDTPSDALRVAIGAALLTIFLRVALSHGRELAARVRAARRRESPAA